MVRPLPFVLLAMLPFIGEGQFSGPLSLLQGDAPDPMEAVDVDGDGDLDLVRLDASFGIVVYSNTDGQGSFAFGGVIADDPASLAFWSFGDITGDGLPDMVAQRFGADGPEQYTNLGNGLFGTATPCASILGSPAALALVDISGDGLRDLVMATYLTDIGTYLYWMENVAGAFGSPQVMPMAVSGVGVPFIRSGDLDLIGGLDLIIQDDAYNLLAYRNTAGDGSLWSVDTLLNTASAPLQNPQLLDIDGDGDLDLGEATFPEVQWIENTLDEGGQWNGWTYHQLEAWDSSGPGTFGHLGCDSGASVVVFPLNPGASVRYSHWVDALGDFAFDNAIADLPRGQAPLLADLNGDGRDDLVLAYNGERLILWNLIPVPTTVVELPELPALCKFGPSFPLPTALPIGGHWSGRHVILDEYFRSYVETDGYQSLGYAVYESEGCAVATAGELLVVEQPTISPTLSGVICSGNGPVQLTSVPPATTWVGSEPDGTIDPATFGNGVVVAIFTDITGETCAAETDPLVVWPSMPAQINPHGPICVNDGPQTITAVPSGGAQQIWSGDIASFNATGATFLPSQGAGIYSIVLTVEPLQPGHCEGFDTLLVTVSDAFPQVDLTPVPTLCSTSAPIDLLPLAIPAGGIWAGPSVVGGSVDPMTLGAGDFMLTYTYESSNGCATSEALAIHILAEATVSVDAADLFFCTVDEPVQFTGFPTGGAWTAPIDANGLLDPAVVGPGDYPVVYTWTGADGCVLENGTSTFYVLPTTTPVIEPVAVLCDDGVPVEVFGSPDGSWSGSVSGSGASVWIDPVSLGAGIWPLSLTAGINGECPGTTTVDVYIEVCTGLTESRLAELSAWPNPFDDVFKVQAGSEALLGLELLDATGRTVIRSGPLAANGLRDVEMAGAAPGAYFLRATQSDGSQEVIRLLKR